MEFITANPTALDIIHTWAQANPFETFAMGTVALMVICHFTKDWI